MKSEQAKLILQAYRPGGEDAGDPRFAEALEQAHRDPALMAWFKEQRALDAAISRKIQQTPLPGDLLETILAGKTFHPRRSPALSPRLLLLAASIVLLLSLGAIWLTRPPATLPTFAACREDMARFLSTFPRLDLETEKLSEIRQWVAGHPTLASAEIPSALQKFPGIGCRTMEWRGKKLGLVCFMVDGEVVHLFLLRSADFPDAMAFQSPQYAQASSLATAIWTRGEVTYLAATRGEMSFLKKLL